MARLAAIELRNLVDGHRFHVAAVAPIEQPQLIVGIPARMAHDLSQDAVETGNHVPVALGPRPARSAPRRELRGYPLTSIDEQDPVVLGHPHRGVALAGKI